MCKVKKLHSPSACGYLHPYRDKSSNLAICDNCIFSNRPKHSNAHMPPHIVLSPVYDLTGVRTDGNIYYLYKSRKLMAWLIFIGNYLLSVAKSRSVKLGVMKFVHYSKLVRQDWIIWKALTAQIFYPLLSASVLAKWVQCVVLPKCRINWMSCYLSNWTRF